jgi:hypothetical protein
MAELNAISKGAGGQKTRQYEPDCAHGLNRRLSEIIVLVIAIKRLKV